MEKKLSTEAKQLKQQYPQASVEVWCEDEHRVGLKPIVRRIWVEEGENPVAQVNWRFEWLWLVTFVHPESGESYGWIVPYINTDVFNLLLADFAEYFGFGQDKHALLVVDQAGWHTSHNLKVPEGIHLSFLPSHSPELQPSERLWPFTDEAIANQSFESLDELEEVLFQRCRAFWEQPDFIRGLTLYHWWPRQADYNMAV